MEILSKFLVRGQKKQGGCVGFDSLEVMSLAAIVQKETQKADERPRVAGVYLNRLKRKMKLQADPTVIYAMKLQLQNFDMVIKRVLYKDLEIKSPYNTYQYKGVPPGPITMPDISSIKAVLNAEQHRLFVFCGQSQQSRISFICQKREGTQQE